MYREKNKLIVQLLPCHVTPAEGGINHTLEIHEYIDSPRRVIVRNTFCGQAALR